MPSISICPRCQRPVCIPVGVDLAAMVRCPLCNAKYPVNAAIPPTLIPVDSDLGAVAAEGELTADGEENDDIIMLPLTSGNDWAESADTGEPAAVAMTQQTEPDKRTKEEAENEAVAVAGQISIAAARRRRHAPKSGVSHILAKLFGLATSGLIGCLVGYYAVAWWFGPQFQAQGWPVFSFLPGIERLTTPPEQAEDLAVKPAAEKAATAKKTDAKTAPKQSDLASPVPTDSPKAPKEQPVQRLPEPVTLSDQALSEKASPEVETPKPEAKLLRPKPGSADYLGPRMPPVVETSQLAKAIEQADMLLASDKQGGPMSPKTYEAFCRLGEALALVNGDEADIELTDRVDDAERLLEKVAGQPELVEKLGQMASGRIDAKSGRIAGILLAGTVKNVAQQGRLWGAVVQLTGHTKNISVLSDREFPTQSDEKVLVSGVVVRDPSANLVGYSGSKPVVVWATALTKMP